MNDNDLNDLIRRTHREPEFTDSFRRDVWDRIAIAEQAAWGDRSRQWVGSLFRWLTLPLPAAAIVVAMAIVGAGLGQIAASEDLIRSYRNAYLVSINPVAAAHNIQE